jgi:hypothetical protein
MTAPHGGLECRHLNLETGKKIHSHPFFEASLNESTRKVLLSRFKGISMPCEGGKGYKECTWTVRSSSFAYCILASNKYLQRAAGPKNANIQHTTFRAEDSLITGSVFHMCGFVDVCMDGRMKAT